MARRTQTIQTREEALSVLVELQAITLNRRPGRQHAVEMQMFHELFVFLQTPTRAPEVYDVVILDANKEDADWLPSKRGEGPK